MQKGTDTMPGVSESFESLLGVHLRAEVLQDKGMGTLKPLVPADSSHRSHHLLVTGLVTLRSSSPSTTAHTFTVVKILILALYSNTKIEPSPAWKAE